MYNNSVLAGDSRVAVGLSNVHGHSYRFSQRSRETWQGQATGHILAAYRDTVDYHSRVEGHRVQCHRVQGHWIQGHRIQVIDLPCNASKVQVPSSNLLIRFSVKVLLKCTMLYNVSMLLKCR